MLRPSARLALVVVSTVVVGAWCVADVWPFLTDDAFISFRFADRLLAGDGLTWTDGERVEGYSNLAWVLACALFGATGLSVPVCARLLGIGCVVAALVLIAARFRGSVASWVAVAVAATTACAPWTIGGLELPLLLVTTTAGLLGLERALASASTRHALSSGGCFAVAALTRPDAPLMASVAGAVLFTATVARLGVVRASRVAVLFALPIAVALAGQLVFRVAYYGDWLANTARVKVGGSVGPFGDGMHYVASAILGMSGLSALAVGGLLLLRSDRERRSFASALAVCVIAWSGYLVVIGGDFFPAHRMMVPLLPMFALLGGLGIEAALAAGKGRLPVALIVVVAIVANRTQAMLHPETARAAAERWEWDGVAIGGALRDAFAARDPLVAVDAAGAVPWASRLRCLDMYGLCDATIARQSDRGAADSAFARAHRRGTPEYLLGRESDVVLFGPAPGAIVPTDAIGLALVDDPRFVAEYRAAWLEVRENPPLSTPLWIRGRGRCGVVERPGEVDVPVWLIGAARMQPGFRATPPTDPAGLEDWRRSLASMLPWLELPSVVRVEDGAVRLEIRRAGEYVCDGLTLSAGSWELLVEPMPSGVTCALTEPTGAPLPRQSDRWEVAEPTHEIRLVVGVSDRAAPFSLRSIRLRRQPPAGR